MIKKNDSEKVTDMSYLKRASGGNVNFIRDMIKIFLKQTPGFIDELKKYGEEQNWQEFRAVMHKLKPTVKMMGIDQLESTIEKTERASKENKDLDKLPETLKELDTVLQKSFTELQEELKSL